ncbi:MAG: glycosyl hydrolase, partial [Verrucomicrobiota bacterium]
MRILSALIFILIASVQAAPVRVLYLDVAGAEQAAKGPLHDLMAAHGRDAIWFDYHREAPSADDLRRYDAVVVVGGSLSSGLPDLSAQAKDPAAFRTALEQALPAGRKAAWQAFLAQREPEVREKDPNVANYENRPEPLTFQKPYSVKGSMERTQVPADMRLVLFAAEPDIAK